MSKTGMALRNMRSPFFTIDIAISFFDEFIRGDIFHIIPQKNCVELSLFLLKKIRYYGHIIKTIFMEIEVRAKVIDTSKVKDFLETKAEFINASDEDDLYLRHESDIERSIVLRIRRKENGAILTFKGKAKGDDTAWPDVDLPLDHPDELENLLLGSRYVEVVRIRKHRFTYRMNEFEINLDEINDLGSFIEVEGRGTDDERDSVEQKITQFLIDLGIQESDVIRKGYVTLMLEKISSSQ